MPKGFAILEWTMEEGLILDKKFPETLEINLDDMMRVFYAHITGSGEKGNVIVRLEKAQSNINSHFTGIESKTPYMINLILELGEDPEMFGDVVMEINTNILQYLNKMEDNPDQKLEISGELDTYLAKMFDFLKRLANLTKEQKIAQIYCSRKGREILKKVQENPISKNELKLYLEENLNQIITNLDISLDSFIQTGLIKEDWITGYRDQFLFLLNDFSILRIPAFRIIEMAKNGRPTSEVAQKYLNQVNEFFSKYKITEEDSLKIASILAHPDKFDVYKLFSNNFYRFDKIPKGPDVGGEELTNIINQLIEERILTRITDIKKEEWVLLLTDINIKLFFPEYLIEKIRNSFNQRKIKEEVAVKHLELLEKAYSK